jgi:hypothetical protein
MPDVNIYPPIDTHFENKCRCGRRLDAATPVGHGAPRTPRPGDISVCAYCGQIRIFGENSRFNPADPAEEQRIVNEMKRKDPKTYRLLRIMQKQFEDDHKQRRN